MTQFHEAFWLGTVTAGPVIALSHAVVIERLTGKLVAVAGVEPFGRWLRRLRGGQSVRPTPRRRKRRVKRPSRRWIVFGVMPRVIVVMLPYIFGTVGFIGAYEATIKGLDSLAHEADSSSTGFVEFELILSMFLVMAVAATGFIAERFFVVMESITVKPPNTRE